MRILVVDDDEAGRYLATSILTSAGHDVVAAGDGVEALETAREQPPDVVVSDILMPRMDGFQLAREWKSDDVLRRVPLVFLTASYTDPADEKFAIELGADGFLSKPVEPEALVETVERAASQEGEPARAPAVRPETETLKSYGERIVRKLEQKVVELERANGLLKEAMGALTDEVAAKGELIDQLHQQIELTERRASELRRERDFSARIIDTAEASIIAWDASGRVTLFSPGAERTTGYAAREVIGQDFVDLLVAGDHQQAQRRSLERVLREDSKVRSVVPIVRADGTERSVDWTFTRLADTEGRGAGVMGIGVDITEILLNVHLERVTSAVDRAVLSDARIRMVLDAACQALVREFSFSAVWAAELGGEGEIDILAAAGSPELVEALLQAGAGQYVCPVGDARALAEPVLIGAETAGLPQQWRSFAEAVGVQACAVIPVRTHGAVAALLGVISSRVGSLVQVSEALGTIADRLGVGMIVAQARDQLRLQSAALASAASAIVICDARGTVEWVNPSFEHLTGYQSDEVVGEALFGPGEDRYREPAYAERWDDVLAGEVWRFSGPNTGRDGGEYVESVTVAPVASGGAGVDHVVIVKQDITERSRFEQLRSDFVAMVSHELRTPLTSIIGYADLMKHMGPEADLERMGVAVAKIQLSAAQMHEQIERLLEVAQMQSEGVTLQPSTTDLRGVVRGVVGALQLGPEHELRLDLPDDPVECFCDADRLGRAVGSLVENAVKFSPQGGAIGVAVTRDVDHAVVRVTDEGVGMPELQIPVMFEAFRQLDMSSTREFGGIGLGLFLAYRIAEAHGGSLSGSSRQGEGSTFQMRLPMTPDAAG